MKPSLRMILPIVFSGALVASLAACTPSAQKPAPSTLGPTPQTSGAPIAVASCTPDNAVITWHLKTQVKDIELGYFIDVVGADLTTTSTKTDLDPRSSFSQDAIDELTNFTPSANTAWYSGLLKQVRANGQVSDTFGTRAELPEQKSGYSVAGTFVTSVGMNQYQVKFEATCPGKAPVSGWITAAEVGGFASYTVRCGDPDVEDLEYARLAHSHCPSP